MVEDHEGYEDVNPLFFKKSKDPPYSLADKARQDYFTGRLPELKTTSELYIEELARKGRFDLIEELKYKRPELAKWVNQIINDMYDDHEQRMREWK
jgi:hypothetical protein